LIPLSHYFYILGTSPGPIKDYTTNKTLGTHKGLWFHTIGQRKGLGLLLDSVVHEGPWFVVGKDIPSNTLLVTNTPDVVILPRKKFSVDSINWISGPPPGLDTGVELLVKLRHGPKFGTAMVKQRARQDNVSSTDVLDVELEQLDTGIAPGQFAAFYSEGICLGAGAISETVPDELFSTTSSTVDMDSSTSSSIIQVF
jgi:tRNA-specific 2-thiouridylase